DPSFLPKPAGNLQPRSVGRRHVAHRRCAVADPLEIRRERAALLAPGEVLIELRAADRPEPPVDVLLSRCQILRTRHKQLSVSATSYQLPAASFQLPAASLQRPA